MLLQNTAGEEMDLEGIMRQLMYISNVAQQYLRCSMAFYLDDKLPVPKMPDLWEKLLHMQGENVTLRSGVFRLKEAPRQPHIFRVPQIRTWNTLLKDGYPEAVKQEAMTLLDEMSARGEMNADSLRSFYQDFMQMIYFTVGGSEEKIHELFYQPEALELYRNGMKSVDEMKALIRYVTSSWTEHKSVDESKELLDKLKQYIDEHLESELRRDELAEYVHLNPDYLTRLMKKQTGYSLKEYVTRRKMETARTLLRTTTLPVGFIAAKLGYNNFSHFSYTYKKIMDVTPQEERHTEKNEAETVSCGGSCRNSTERYAADRLWQSQAGGPAAHYQAAHGRVLFRSRVPAHWRSIERTDRGKVWIYGRDLPTVHHQL